MMLVEELISTMDLWSFIAAIVSLVLAIVAIVISVLFYVLGRDDTKWCKSVQKILLRKQRS